MRRHWRCARPRRKAPNRSSKRARSSMRPATVAISSTSAVRAVALLTGALVLVALAAPLEAHGVSGKDAVYLQSVQGRAIGPLIYLGAKHMVTGYDHLAF